MKTENTQIFRADAIRRYVQQQQKAVLPRFLCPRTFVYLWILLVLLLVAGVVITWLFHGSLFTVEACTESVLLAQSQPLASRTLLNFQAEEECR
jgi:hypothetical protein